MALAPRAVGWWLQEALAIEEAATEGGRREDLGPFDVAIVGGGYTGLWTAWWLAERQPDARIAVIEQGICGGGPSGRNGGFVHGWWDQLPYLLERFGADHALRLAHLVDEAVGTIGAWCRANDVDAWYRHGGYLRVSASTAQDGEWRSAVEACAGLGVADQYVELTRGRDPGALRLAGDARWGADAERGDGPARPAGARPAARAGGSRRDDPGRDTRGASAPGSAGPARNGSGARLRPSRWCWP